MNKNSKIFKNLIHLTNLLLNFLYSLLSFLNDSLIEGNLIVQQQDLLSATNDNTRLSLKKRKDYCNCDILLQAIKSMK